MIDLFKKYAWLKLVLGILAAVAGIVTIALAIVALCDSSFKDPTVALRFIVGILFLFVGGLVVFAEILGTKERSDFRLLALGALAIGFGVFFLLKDAVAFLNILVARLYPILIAAVGCAFILKGIACLCTKKPVGVSLWLLIGGAVAAALGIVFAIFAAQWGAYVAWILVGLSIAIGGIVEIVFWSKGLHRVKKAEKELE